MALEALGLDTSPVEALGLDTSLLEVLGLVREAMDR